MSIVRACGSQHVHGEQPNGYPPTIEQSTQIFSNILGTLAGDVRDKAPIFPMKEAFDKARSEVANVVIPDGRPPVGFRRPDVLPPLVPPPDYVAGNVNGQTADETVFQEGLFEGDDDAPCTQPVEDDRHIPDDCPAGPRPPDDAERAVLRRVLRPPAAQPVAQPIVDPVPALPDTGLGFPAKTRSRFPMGLREFHFNVWSSTARWKPPKGQGPSPDISTLLARSIQDVQNFHYYEYQRVVVGFSEEQLTEELIQKGTTTTLRHLHITLYFDPKYQQEQRV